jgi:hypothetical protein
MYLFTSFVVSGSFNKAFSAFENTASHGGVSSEPLIGNGVEGNSRCLI